MTKYRYKFVVVNSIPHDLAAANDLSVQMGLDYGNNGWQLVSVTPITDSNGMLLSFQKLAE